MASCGRQQNPRVAGVVFVVVVVVAAAAIVVVAVAVEDGAAAADGLQIPVQLGWSAIFLSPRPIQVPNYICCTLLVKRRTCFGLCVSSPKSF